MAYITACEIKEGLARLKIPMVAARCECKQCYSLADHDRRCVTVGGRDGVLISYHLADPDPNDCQEVIVAFSYPTLHHPVSDQIQQMLTALFI